MGANSTKMPSKTGPTGHTGHSLEREAATTKLREHMIREAINENSPAEMEQMVKYIDPNACLASGEGLLIFAMKHGTLDAVRLLMKHGADVNKTDDTGSRPLHAAVITDQENLVDLLIDNGAKVNQVDSTGLNPLHLACSKGNKSITKRLIEAGAKPNEPAKNNDKNTALILASSNGHEDCVKVLLEGAADPDLTDMWGFTALSKSTINDKEGCVRLLLSHNADLNVGNRSLATPLQYAAIRNNCDILEVLGARGADVSKYNVDILPLAAAALNGCPNCLSKLLKYGTKTEWTDRQNKTALFHALADKPKIDHLYKSYPLKRPETRHPCVDLLIDAGADMSKVWKSKFWESRERSPQQMALYKKAIRAFGFKDIPSSAVRALCHKLCMSGCGDAVQLFCVAGYTPEGGALCLASPPGGTTSCQACTYDSDQAAVYCNMLQLTEDPINAWLKKRSVSPLPLKHLCRLHIRKLISNNVIYYARHLQISRELKDYICISNHKQYD